MAGTGAPVVPPGATGRGYRSGRSSARQPMAASAESRGTDELAAQLWAHREEVEAAILARIHAIEDVNEPRDAEYLDGLRAAVATAVALAVKVQGGEEFRPDRVPHELMAQARLAARRGVSLGTVIRRYIAGHTLLCEFLLRHGVEGEARRALRAQLVLLDQVISTVTDIYGQETEQRSRTVERRHAEKVKKVIEGNPVEALDLGYEFEGWRLGIVAHGSGAPRALREHARVHDRRLLLVKPGGKEVWAWFGSSRHAPACEVATQLSEHLEPDMLLAIGEPGRGISGWRLTHRQAKAALPVGLRGESQVVTYSTVALLASVITDELLVSSLSEIYLAPLADERDGGAALRETLSAYFAAGRNIASAAAALGVSRQTVARRIALVEEKIARSLISCGTEMETALFLDGLICKQAPRSHPAGVR